MVKKFDPHASRTENVQPIKKRGDMRKIEKCLLEDFELGRRNLTLFHLGVVTMLRASDLCLLKVDDVYDSDGKVLKQSVVHEKKTGKRKYISPDLVEGDLLKYWQWREDQGITSDYLFVSKNGKPLKTHDIWMIFNRVQDLTGLNYLGSHSMRKTGAYKLYKKTGNLAMVMELLNHSSIAMTLRYLGLDRQTQNETLHQIDFFN